MYRFWMQYKLDRHDIWIHIFIWKSTSWNGGLSAAHTHKLHIKIKIANGKYCTAWIDIDVLHSLFFFFFSFIFFYYHICTYILSQQKYFEQEKTFQEFTFYNILKKIKFFRRNVTLYFCFRSHAKTNYKSPNNTLLSPSDFLCGKKSVLIQKFHLNP